MSERNRTLVSSWINVEHCIYGSSHPLTTLCGKGGCHAHGNATERATTKAELENGNARTPKARTPNPDIVVSQKSISLEYNGVISFDCEAFATCNHSQNRLVPPWPRVITYKHLSCYIAFSGERHCLPSAQFCRTVGEHLFIELLA